MRMKHTTEIEKLAWGTDAGFYRLKPQEVHHPKTEESVQMLFTHAFEQNKSITFRAAGTSLSGQAISDSILAVIGKIWEKYEILDQEGLHIRLQPGIIGQRVNDILAPLGRKFTPDPASIKSAMIGGIVMNNASGMSCGTHANSLEMLDSARIILTDGTILDTSSDTSKEDFRASHPDFVKTIEELRDQVREDTELVERIQKKYQIKNVTGLTISPFLRYDDPFDIIAHLMVGSEGTLAFLSEVRMRTGVLATHSASAMLYFGDVRSACNTIIAMRKCEVTAAEFFDRKAMRAVEQDFPELKEMPEGAVAVLVKIEGMSTDELNQKITQVNAIVDDGDLLKAYHFSSNAQECNKYWAMRSGIFPSVGSMRPIGTTCLIEDVAFPLEYLADATAELQALLAKHKYDDAVIYGHALEGNYHFILNQKFDSEEAVLQYYNMMEDVVKLVVDKYDGSLKAEHGTGRNMAPYVRREWGEKAYALMVRVKQLFDPNGILNPGVIFNEEPYSHVQNLKPLPQLHPIVDKCIECGFCEVNCVSCGFALSSRQRIVVQREIARLRMSNEDPQLLKTLEKEFLKIGEQLCAGDGLCATSCPIGINVGEYIHHLRAENVKHSKLAQQIGKLSATHFAGSATGVKAILHIANGARNVLGNKFMQSITGSMHKLSGEAIPLWSPALPKPSRKMPHSSVSDNPLKVVYFPSCINQTMGVSKGDTCELTLVNELTQLLQKAGYDVIFPQDMRKLCCGTIWESKGMEDIANQKSAELELALYRASENGKYPVLCDQSPCLYRMRHTMQHLDLYEPVEFIDKYLLSKLDITPIDESITIHPTCSTIKMGQKDTLIKIARMCANEVLVPEEIGCCGFAGDKGFTSPELNK